MHSYVPPSQTTAFKYFLFSPLSTPNLVRLLHYNRATPTRTTLSLMITAALQTGPFSALRIVSHPTIPVFTDREMRGRLRADTNANFVPHKSHAYAEYTTLPTTKFVIRNHTVASKTRATRVFRVGLLEIERHATWINNCDHQAHFQRGKSLFVLLVHLGL